jgi:hypothetical protein
MRELGYLQFGNAQELPMYTVSVPVEQKSNGSDWRALFEGKWRKVHIQVNRTYIIYMGKKITINIEGV